MSERDSPPLEVLCSCGKTTRLRWNGARWEADDPAWVYDAHDPVDAVVDTLWSCGEPCHYQLKVRAFKEPEAVKP